MANNQFGSITKYTQNMIDTINVTESCTGILEDLTKKWVKVDFNKAGYVEVADIAMTGLSNYKRANTGAGVVNGYSNYNGSSRDGYKVGNVQFEWTPYKLRFDRGTQFQIDSLDNEENAEMVMANLMVEHARTKVIPEKDAVYFSTLASKCHASLGNLIVDETINENEIIKKFNAAFTWLKDHEVKDDSQVLFVSTDVWEKMLNTTELFKHITQAEYKTGDVSFEIHKYMGRPVIVVPSSRFYDKITLGDGAFYPAAGAKAINFMVVAADAVTPVVKVDKTRVFGPAEVQDFDGYKANFRIHYDIIVPKNKVVCVYTSVSAAAADTKTNLLDVVVEGSGQTWTVTEAYTTPAGILGQLVRQTGAMKVGTKYNSAKAVEIGTSFEKDAATEYFAIVDSNKVALAVSKAVSLA